MTILPSEPLSPEHSLTLCLSHLQLPHPIQPQKPVEDDTETQMEQLRRGLEHAGIETQIIPLQKNNWQQLRAPALVHWNLHHFVVMERIGTNGIHIWDPVIGRRVYRVMEFMELASVLGRPRPLLFFPNTRQSHSDGSLLGQSLRQEQREENLLSRRLTLLAGLLSPMGQQRARSLMERLCLFWDVRRQPAIFNGPERNLLTFLALTPKDARRIAQRNIAQLALNMGYTGYLLKILQRGASLERLDKRLKKPLRLTGAQQLQGQCILELMHMHDPVTAVYNAIRYLPPGRDLVVFGNPWHDAMFDICERAAQDNGLSLTFVAPSGKTAFLKLMKRVKRGAHAILFADGSPLFATVNNSGLQLARSFSPCMLWQQRAFLTATGAVLAKQTGASLFLATLHQQPDAQFCVTRLTENASQAELPELIQSKADQMGQAIAREPHAWLFWRNAEVFFHDYEPFQTTVEVGQA